MKYKNKKANLAARQKSYDSAPNAYKNSHKRPGSVKK